MQSNDDQADPYGLDALVRGDCEDALHTLYDYLDGELTDQRRQAIRRHLEQCAPCLQAFDFESEVKALVARCCRDEVPESLRVRVADALHKAAETSGGPS